MATETLNLEVKSNIESVTKNTDKYVVSLEDVAKAQKEALVEYEKFIAAQKEQKKIAKDTIGNFRLMGVSLNGVKKSMSKVIPTAKAMFSTIKAGIISTGIGILLIAFGVLMTWLTKTKKGAEFLERAFAGVGAAVSVIVDRISKFAGAVGKLFSGDVKGALTDVKGALSGIGDEISREIDLAVELKGKLQLLADSERALNVELAQKREEIEKYKSISKDVNKTEEERLENAEKALKLETEFLNTRIANAEQAVNIQRQQNEMSKKMSEDLDELADKEIALANLKLEGSRKEREGAKTISGIRKEFSDKRTAAHEKRLREIEEEKQAEIDRINAIQAANLKVEEESLTRAVSFEEARQALQDSLDLGNEKDALLKSDKLLEIQLQAESDAISALKISDEEKQKLRELHFKRRTQLLEENLANDAKLIEASELLDVDASKLNLERIQGETDAELKIRMDAAQKLEDFKKDLQMKAFQALGSHLDASMDELEGNYSKEKRLAEANGQDTAAIDEKYEEKRKRLAGQQKAFKVAEALITTYQMASLAYKDGLEAGGPYGLVLGPIAAGVAAVAGLANVRQILAQDVGAGGGGNTPSPSATPPAPQMMSGAFELTGGQEPEPMQAYVVSDDITNNQNKLAIIRRRATI
tara:strand:+ start:201 stop:2132 length:1932 start_codon:yes stop_codon:yes gene_type:complete